MNIGEEKRITFFGCPLDSDERDESILEKMAIGGIHPEKSDPYPFIMDILRREVGSQRWSELFSIDVPGWLKAIPSLDNMGQISTEKFVGFIDSGGCKEYSELVARLITERIYPDIPCMLGIDHSLTYGAFAALSELYGPNTISLVILDSHLDAVPVDIISEAVQYDIESNPNSVHDRNDPYLYNRPKSLNASTFIDFILSQSYIQPPDLYVIGISDYPPKKAFRIKDKRIQNYVKQYSGLRNKGACIITKKDISTNFVKLKHLLKKIKTPYVYISIDMDVGSRNAVEGVRFKDWMGLNESQLMSVVDQLKEAIPNSTDLVGLDIMEMNPRIAGNINNTEEDRTYEIAAKLVKKLCFDYALKYPG